MGPRSRLPVTIGLAIALPLAALTAGIWYSGMWRLLFPLTGPLHITSTNPSAARAGQAGVPGQSGGTANLSNKDNGQSTIQPQNNESSGSYTTPQTGNPVEQQIVDNYLAKLRSLAEGYEARLNGLVGDAWSQYVTARRQGRQTSFAVLAARYIGAGTTLEKECDAQFYSTLNDFKAELRRNGFSTDIAAQAQQEYEWAKANRKKEILAAATKAI